MKSLSRNKILFLIIGMLFAASMAAQVPDRPLVPYAVNDYASVLSSSERSAMESRLVRFAEKSSNRIVVITVNNLGDLSPSQYAYEVGEKWGVGSSSFNNGIVILVKPKVGNQSGQCFIAVGYGLEGVIPDATAKRIVDREMIPLFKENDYYAGINAGLDVIIKLASGEISYDEWDQKDKIAGYIKFIFSILVLLICIIALFSGNGPANMDGKGKKNNFARALLLSMLLGGRGGGGGYGGGSGGGFGGGFRGGFGGGSFGGGGAGGSW